MKNRPMKNRTTDELKALLKAFAPFEHTLSEVHRQRLNEIRYELNMRLNPVMRGLKAMFGTVRP